MYDGSELRKHPTWCESKGPIVQDGFVAKRIKALQVLQAHSKAGRRSHSPIDSCPPKSTCNKGRRNPLEVDQDDKPLLRSASLHGYVKSRGIDGVSTRVDQRPNSDWVRKGKTHRVLSPTKITDFKGSGSIPAPTTESGDESINSLEHSELLVPTACVIQEPCPVPANFSRRPTIYQTDQRQASRDSEVMRGASHEQLLFQTSESVVDKLNTYVEHGLHSGQHYSNQKEAYNSNPVSDNNSTISAIRDSGTILMAGHQEIGQDAESIQTTIDSELPSSSKGTAGSQQQDALHQYITPVNERKVICMSDSTSAQTIASQPSPKKFQTSKISSVQRSSSENRPGFPAKKTRTWSLQNLYPPDKTSNNNIELRSLSELRSAVSECQVSGTNPSSLREMQRLHSKPASMLTGYKHYVPEPGAVSAGESSESEIDTIQTKPVSRSVSWFGNSWLRALTAKGVAQAEQSQEKSDRSHGVVKDATIDLLSRIEQDLDVHMKQSKAAHDEAYLEDENISQIRPDTDGPQTSSAREVDSVRPHDIPSMRSLDGSSRHSRSSAIPESSDEPGRRSSRSASKRISLVSASPSIISETPSNHMSRAARPRRTSSESRPSESFDSRQRTTGSQSSQIFPNHSAKSAPDDGMKPKVEYTHQGLQGNGERIKRIQVIITFDGADELTITAAETKHLDQQHGWSS